LARPIAPPPLTLPTGTYKQRVVALLRRYDSVRHNRSRDRHIHLRIAYELGLLNQEEPQVFWDLLNQRYGRYGRTRILKAVKRVVEIATVVDPGQLYDTMVLSIKRVVQLSSHMFSHQLLPNLERRAPLSPDSVTGTPRALSPEDSSEDLAFSEGANVAQQPYHPPWDHPFYDLQWHGSDLAPDP
jgi:hypothetical protein